ncbi:MAG: hypothetical protein EXS63_04300 [Candidatus Omnitrophica bacterium]|nr:hypothetical protein [Candidatus Omnitrophota bacterium]
MATKTLAKLKSEWTFNKDLTYLVDVMKSIAGTQYHIMERKRTDLTHYKKSLDELFSVYDFRLVPHSFIRTAKDAKKLICLVTTDFGFLGGLNMKVVQAGIKHHVPGAHYLVIGERGVTYMREYGLAYTPFPGVNPDDTRFELAAKVQKEIFRMAVKNNYGQVILVFPHAASISSQKIQVLNLIPCPIFFKNKPDQVLTEAEQEKLLIVESMAEELIESMTECWLRHRLVEIFESAKLSEYGARMLHLEDSFQTLSKIDKQMKLEFFKLRREKIDQSLRETATAQLMLQGNHE